jgi:hypothetical protein
MRDRRGHHDASRRQNTPDWRAARAWLELAACPDQRAARAEIRLSRRRRSPTSPGLGQAAAEADRMQRSWRLRRCARGREGHARAQAARAQRRGAPVMVAVAAIPRSAGFESPAEPKPARARRDLALLASSARLQPAAIGSERRCRRKSEAGRSSGEPVTPGTLPPRF